MYRGIFFLFLSTIIWGIPQPLLFNEIKHIPALEVVSHRSIWSFFFLLFGIFFLGKFSLFINIFKDKKLVIGLSITGLLIAINWSGFIISISLEKLQDASLGYYISPLIYIALGYLPHEDSEFAFIINGSENLMSKFEIKKNINGYNLSLNLIDDLINLGDNKEASITLNKIF